MAWRGGIRVGDNRIGIGVVFGLEILGLAWSSVGGAGVSIGRKLIGANSP